MGVSTEDQALNTRVPPTARTPELLAPAGDWECAKAAVENGADAIYFGLEKFNARMRAHNFTETDLPTLMEFLHQRGVRGYVTFNTLVFPDELTLARNYLRSIITAGVDAAIVQDVGICRLIREISPDFPIHASTQMTITSAAGVEFAKDLGCSLVVLARECSIKEIEKIQEKIASGSSVGETFPLEVFVHGALCVAYSGQCLTSESLGGRSANRGECAQACRMPYELISDGKTVPLGDRKYLLSPQDLAGLEVLPELLHSGVRSLKIEGRLKTPEYVANITRVYREAVDQIVNHSSAATHEAQMYDLQMGFSRGLYTGWFAGINNQKLVHARFGKKRGVYLGDVKGIRRDEILISAESPLKAGDGIVFDAGHPESKEEGGRVYQVLQPRPGEYALRFGRGDIDFSLVHVGDRVWKTSDPELDRRLRQTFDSDQPRFTRPLDFEVHGRAGTLITVIARDELGHIARADSTMNLETALKQPLTSEFLQQQLGRLGGTPFHIGRVENRLEGGVVLPVKELNRLRRELVTELQRQRALPKQWQMNPPVPLPSICSRSPNNAEPELVVLVRNLDQLDAALSTGIRKIYCEFEDLKKYREAVTRVHTGSCDLPEREIWVAPPRIFKMGEEWILDQVLSSRADGYLVRNYDHLKAFATQRRIADFSLNVANALSAQYFMDREVERVTASYDLNIDQLTNLLKSAPAEWFEVTLHQHMPMFHMEHCVFCAFLSDGTDYRDCGRPCDKHEVKLKDRVGAQHPLKADAGCRNTVFNAMAQTGAEFFERLTEAGARRFRVEFLNETPEEVRTTIAQYRKLLRGETSGSRLWRELRLLNQLGVTRGQLAGSKVV